MTESNTDLPLANKNIMPVVFELLIRITARQMALTKYLLEVYSSGSPSELTNNLRIFENEVQKARSTVVQNIYSEFGVVPPEIKDILDKD